VSATPILRPADELWSYLLATQPVYVLRTGCVLRRLRHESLDDAEKDASFGRSLRARLREVARTELGSTDEVTWKFLDDACQRLEEAPDCWWTSFAYTPYNASGIGFYAQRLLPSHSFSDGSDAELYLQLMADLAGLIRAQTARTLVQAQRGWRVPRPALAGCRATLTGQRAAAARWLRVEPDRLAALDTAARNRLTERIESMLAKEVLPAFDDALATIGSDYERVAPETVGLGQYPGGDAAYALWVRRHMTCDLAAEQIYRLGMREVDGLTQSMAEIRSRLGFAGGEADFAVHLRESGRLYARTAENVEQRYRACIERMRPRVAENFRVIPKAPYDIKRLDPSAEPGMSYGYYESPSTGSPIGLYHYNGSDLDRRPQLAAPALIYHELVPGHHFHLARQAENEALPTVRRQCLDISVFNEGWAEYASGLAGEIGLYDDPYDAYGRLLHERFTAQRLVIDTGLNALGWSLDRAREFMARYTLESAQQIATETLRYSTDMPGQALTYRVGYLKFMELRERAHRALGSSFDLREFHEAILGEGALPLHVLETHMTRWANRQRSANRQ
jgi:uncharacterized protein (DUF885 family)